MQIERVDDAIAEGEELCEPDGAAIRMVDRDRAVSWMKLYSLTVPEEEFAASDLFHYRFRDLDCHFLPWFSPSRTIQRDRSRSDCVRNRNSHRFTERQGIRRLHPPVSRQSRLGGRELGGRPAHRRRHPLRPRNPSGRDRSRDRKRHRPGTGEGQLNRDGVTGLPGTIFSAL